MTTDTDLIRRAIPLESVVSETVNISRGGNADELVGKCPFHDDSTPSFTVTKSKGLFKCFGCDAAGDVFEFVMRRDGLSFPEALKMLSERAGLPVPSRKPLQGKVVAEYLYLDEHGEVLYRVQRVEPGRNGAKKEFRQSRPHPMDGEWVWSINGGPIRKSSNGGWYPVKGAPAEGDDDLPPIRRVLYRLPELLTAETVYVVEGEKDADTLRNAGLVATTNSGGAGNEWLPEYSEVLRGRRVVVIPDGDEPGRKRGATIMAALEGIAEAVSFEVPAGKDVTDWFAVGGDTVALEGLAAKASLKMSEARLEAQGLWSVQEIVENYRGGVSALLNPKQRPKGIATGFHGFDAKTLGLHAGELVILAARPAMGKTALALNIADYVANTAGPVAVFSMEMSRSSLLDRAICSRAGIDQIRFRAGDYNSPQYSDERRRIQLAISELSEMPLFIDQRPGVGLPYVVEKTEALRRRAGSLSLVVIDYLQLMGGKAKENRNQEVSALSRGLKIFSQEAGVPVLALSQLSRATDQRQGDNIPQLSDLRDSGGIEQDADVVLFVYRPEMYDKEGKKPELRGIAKLIIAKQRNGPTGMISFRFHKESTRFEDVSPRERTEND
jgi:replicative DNA helicase